MVEYVLLLGVLMSLAATVFKSDIWQDLLGSESEIFNALRIRLQYSYRHGIPGDQDETGNETGSNHDSYYNGGETRFFSPTDPYPE